MDDNSIKQGYFFCLNGFGDPSLCQAIGGQLFEELTVSDLLSGILIKV